MFVIFITLACEEGKAPDKTAERVLEAIPQAEIASEPDALAPTVAWALDQALPTVRFWEMMNVEAALDFVGTGPAAPALFAGLPLGITPPDLAPVRIPRRQEEGTCPIRVDRSEAPTGIIDFELQGGCEADVGNVPVRYDGRILVRGEFQLGGFDITYRWDRWREDSPFGRKEASGNQTLKSRYEPDGAFSLSLVRLLEGAAGRSGDFSESFSWGVSGQDGREARLNASWLLVSPSSRVAMRSEMMTELPDEKTGVSVQHPPSSPSPARGEGTRKKSSRIFFPSPSTGEGQGGGERLQSGRVSTSGALELGLSSGGAVPLFLNGTTGRVTVRFEGLQFGACPGDRRQPTAGRLIFESANAVEIFFTDDCHACGALADGRKVCWAEAAPGDKPAGTLSEPPAETSTSEPPAPPTPVVPVPAVEPAFTAEIQIVPDQVSLPSQDVAVALPEGYRAVNVEGDVSGIFFDRAEGVRGLAVASAVEAGSLAIKLGDALKKGVRVNGTSLPAETTATVSTVNSLRLTSVDGKPMALQTFSLSFSAPRAWEGVAAQIAAAVGAPGKTDVSMPGLDLGSASGVSSKEYVAMVGSVPRESGKSLHAAAVVPLESFDERSVEMFQTVGAATRANARLVKKEETFVAQAQGPQINVSSSIVDVLWVIDDSGSMSEEQSNLATNFDAFFRQFRALNLDYHLGVVTSDCDSTGGSTYYSSDTLCGALRKLSNGAVTIDPNTAQAETEWATISRPGTSGSGNEKPLLAAREALTSRVTDNTNAGFRRAGASLVVILVTDEVDHSYEGAYKNSRLGSTYTPYTPPAPFTQFMQTQGAAVFAITGDPADSYSSGGCSSVNGSAEPGNAVIEVAESSGGSWASICSSTFAPTLSLLSQAIGTRSSRFKLSQPAIPSRIRVFVDGVEARRSLTQKVGSAFQTQDGFVYDIASRTISFAGTRFTPKPGQTVRVVYLVVEGST